MCNGMLGRYGDTFGKTRTTEITTYVWEEPAASSKVAIQIGKKFGCNSKTLGTNTEIF